MIIFSCEEISVVFSPTVLLRFEEIRHSHDFSKEIGGILVGTLNPARKQILITDITEPYEKDKCSKYSFSRSEFGHQEAMDQLWEESNNTKTYLGEWHTHNQSIPVPSLIDRKNWISISHRQQNSKHLIFAILGTEKIKIWNTFRDEIHQMEQYNI